MALITTWSSTLSNNNYFKQEHQRPATRNVKTLFSAIVSTNDGGYVSLPFWWVESITTQYYSYVGMSKACADACAEAMVTLWTKSKWNPSLGVGGYNLGDYTNQLCADIRTIHVEGAMWQVDVDVKDVTKSIEAFITET